MNASQVNFILLLAVKLSSRTKLKWTLYISIRKGVYLQVNGLAIPLWLLIIDVCNQIWI